MTNTDTLLDQLASDGAAPESNHSARFFGPLLAVLALSCAAVALVLDGAFANVPTDGIGPISMKWGFSVALLLLTGATLFVLGQPGRPSKVAMLTVAIPFVPVAALFVFEVAMMGFAAEGDTWRNCLAAMLTISPIAFLASTYAMRAMAPTDLRRAGLVAGLFGGAVAMTAYSPFCPEKGMGYMATFYILPILTMAGLGWLTGPRLLRW